MQGVDSPQLFMQDDPRVGSVFTNDQISYKVRFEFGAGIVQLAAVCGVYGRDVDLTPRSPSPTRRGGAEGGGEVRQPSAKENLPKQNILDCLGLFLSRLRKRPSIP